MEPAGILTCIDLSASTIKICWKIGKALKCLLKGIGRDDPLSLLHSEFNALRRNLKTVKAVFLKANETARTKVEKDLILPDVKDSLRECHRHAGHLSKYLAKYVDPDNACALSVTQIQAAISKLREHDLNAKRVQVRGLRNDVQMIISMVTMSVGFSLLSLIGSGPEQLDAVRHNLEYTLKQDEQQPLELETESLASANLRASARRLLSDTQELSPLVRAQRTFAENPMGNDQSCDGHQTGQALSELLETGTFQNQDNRIPAGAWLSQSSTASTDSLESFDTSSEDAKTADANSDAEFSTADNLQWLRDLAAQGRMHNKNGSTDKAVQSLESALKYASRLSPTASEEEELADIYLLLASLHLGRNDVQTSEKYMAKLKNDRKSKEGYLLLICDINFRQAELLLQQSDLRRAKARCQSSLNGRAKVLGKSSMPYYKSVRLMARICSHMGDEPEAEVMVSKLPPDMQDDVVARSPSIMCENSVAAIPISKNRYETKARGLAMFSSTQKYIPKPEASSGKPPSTHSFPPGLQSSPTLVVTPLTSDRSSSFDVGEDSGPPAPLSLDSRIRQSLSRGGFVADFDACAALVWAIDKNDRSVIRALLGGISVKAPVTSKWSRRRSSDAPVLKQFDAKYVASRACRKVNPLVLAVERGQADTVAQLLHKGAPTVVRDAAGTSPLLAAARSGQLEITEQLLARDAPVDDAFGDRRGRKQVWTPLHAACQAGHTDLATLLLGHGARTDRPAANGVTPLHVAVKLPSADLLQVLLERSRHNNLDAADEEGQTPLMQAARKGRTAAVRKLIAHGATIDCANRMKRTALIWAVLNGHAEVVQVLMEAGADPRRVDASRCSALLAATKTGDERLVKIVSAG